MNEALADKIRELPVSIHRGQRMVRLADVLGIVTEPAPPPAVVEAPRIEAASVEAAALEPQDEPQPSKVARRRAEAGDR